MSKKLIIGLATIRPAPAPSLHGFERISRCHSQDLSPFREPKPFGSCRFALVWRVRSHSFHKYNKGPTSSLLKCTAEQLTGIYLDSNEGRWAIYRGGAAKRGCRLSNYAPRPKPPPPRHLPQAELRHDPPRRLRRDPKGLRNRAGMNERRHHDEIDELRQF